jgi:hypothetical protein
MDMPANTKERIVLTIQTLPNLVEMASPIVAFMDTACTDIIAISEKIRINEPMSIKT